MPHAELKYSSTIDLDAEALLRDIEATILRHDPNAGDCKGRAFAVDTFHHTHLIADIVMLPKPHRDAKFVTALRADLVERVRAAVPRPCWVSLELRFCGAHYLTELLE